MSISKAPELKYYDTIIPATTLTSLTSMNYLCNGIAQGVGDTQRIGKSINIMKLQYKLKFIASDNGSGLIYPVTIRILSFVDKECVQANPGISTDILENTSTTLLGMCSHLMLKNNKRFLVIEDTVVELDGGHGQDYFHETYKEIGINTIYGNANGNVAAITTNPIFLYIWGSNSTQPATVTGQIRVRYTDV